MATTVGPRGGQFQEEEWKEREWKERQWKEGLKIGNVPITNQMMISGNPQVVEQLKGLYCDLVVLNLKNTSYYWNISDPKFLMIRHLLKKHGKCLFKASNHLAERIRVLNHHTPGTLTEISQFTRFRDVPNRVPPAMEMLVELWDNHALVHKSLKELHRFALNEDPVTAILLLKAMEKHERMMNHFRSHMPPEFGTCPSCVRNFGITPIQQQVSGLQSGLSMQNLQQQGQFQQQGMQQQGLQQQGLQQQGMGGYREQRGESMGYKERESLGYKEREGMGYQQQGGMGLGTQSAMASGSMVGPGGQPQVVSITSKVTPGMGGQPQVQVHTSSGLSSHQ